MPGCFPSSETNPFVANKTSIMNQSCYFKIIKKKYELILKAAKIGMQGQEEKKVNK